MPSRTAPRQRGIPMSGLKTGELVTFACPTGMRRGLLLRLDVFEATIQTMDGERLVIDADLIRGRNGKSGVEKRSAERRRGKR